MSEVKVNYPVCKRQCDVDLKTLVCQSCGLYFGD